MTYFDQNADQMYQFFKPNPRMAHVPPAPTAPPAPPRMALFNTESNRMAAWLGLAGMLLGSCLICGGVGSAVGRTCERMPDIDLGDDSPAGRKGAKAGAAKPTEKAALIGADSSGAAPGYGAGLTGVTARPVAAAAAASAATGLHNRL